MANPILVDCPAGQWTLVATNVVTGFIYTKQARSTIYMHTYRLTGEAAPTNRDEGVQFISVAPIVATQGIDVYIWAENDNGRVRVDAD